MKVITYRNPHGQQANVEVGVRELLGEFGRDWSDFIRNGLGEFCTVSHGLHESDGADFTVEGMRLTLSHDRIDTIEMIAENEGAFMDDPEGYIEELEEIAAEHDDDRINNRVRLVVKLIRSNM